jgi:3-hydroxymyristoyl/3-hydroxydecanoyl-(acyl carrier protein) dehydratase
MLPHAYPFRLLERGPDRGTALPLRWTVNGALDRGVGAMPPVVAVEMLAPAALVLLGGAGAAGGGGGGLLAGLEGVRFHAPLLAGDRLEAHATVHGRFGRLVKVRAWIARGGETVVEGELLLALS